MKQVGLKEEERCCEHERWCGSKHLATRWDSDKLLPSSPLLHRATYLMSKMMLMMVIMLQNSNFISASSLNAWVQKNVGRHLWCCCSFSFKFYLSCVSFKLWVFGPYFKCQNYLFDRSLQSFYLKRYWLRNEDGGRLVTGWGCRTLIRLRLTLKCPRFSCKPCTTEH